MQGGGLFFPGLGGTCCCCFVSARERGVTQFPADSGIVSANPTRGYKPIPLNTILNLVRNRHIGQRRNAHSACSV